MIYLLPIETVDGTRSPLGLQASAFGKNPRIKPGIDCRWSLKDFGGDLPLGIVFTDQPVPHGVRIASREAVGFMKDHGISIRWIERARSEQERIYRMLGMAFAMQAGTDNPDAWLAREIHYGFGKLDPFDRERYEMDLEASLPRLGEWVMRGACWVSERTGRMLPVIAGGAVVKTETFATASDQNLTAYDTNYKLNDGNFWVRDPEDDVIADDGTSSIAHWEGNTFNNAQYAQVVIKTIGGFSFIGAAVRCAASTTNTAYYFMADSSLFSALFKHVAGTETQLGSNAGVFAAGNTIYVDANGTTITPKKNGSTTGTPGAQTDSSISSGYAGLSGYLNSGATSGDDMELGDIGSAAASLLANDRVRRNQDMLTR